MTGRRRTHKGALPAGTGEPLQEETPPEGPKAEAPTLPATQKEPPGARTFHVSVGGRSLQITVGPAESGNSRPRTYNVSVAGRTFQITVEPADAAGPGAPLPRTPVKALTGTSQQLASGQWAVVAPMPGILLRYAVEVGQRVMAGATTAVLEAMKMELTLPAPANGVVEQLCAGPGSKVPRGAHLVIIGPG